MKKNIKKHKKAFYHCLLKVETIFEQLKKMGLSSKEEREIWDLIEETIHTRTLQAILGKLPSEKHRDFLERFSQKPDDVAILDFLEAEVSDIRIHIKEVFEELEKGILKDILASLEEE